MEVSRATSNKIGFPSSSQFRFGVRFAVLPEKALLRVFPKASARGMIETNPSSQNQESRKAKTRKQLE